MVFFSIWRGKWRIFWIVECSASYLGFGSYDLASWIGRSDALYVSAFVFKSRLQWFFLITGSQWWQYYFHGFFFNLERQMTNLLNCWMLCLLFGFRFLWFSFLNRKIWCSLSFCFYVFKSQLSWVFFITVLVANDDNTIFHWKQVYGSA